MAFGAAIEADPAIEFGVLRLGVVETPVAKVDLVALSGPLNLGFRIWQHPKARDLSTMTRVFCALHRGGGGRDRRRGRRDCHPRAARKGRKPGIRRVDLARGAPEIAAACFPQTLQLGLDLPAANSGKAHADTLFCLARDTMAGPRATTRGREGVWRDAAKWGFRWNT